MRRLVSLAGCAKLPNGYAIEVQKEAEQILQYENLPIASGTRANSDCRDVQRCGDLRGQMSRHAFQNQ
jgi:hypothetical protein